jgi:ParB family transcriptional regulator, chromosome partitioning protein
MEPSMSLSLDGLDLLAPGGVPESGVPLRLPIASIDEDPDQPRQEFDDESLAELTATIRARGVRQPVSVREHPDQPGRWRLNFGARRLRASTLAGLSEIPAFVDNTADSYDQVIENEQRQGLTPLELALFVQRRLRTGESQPDIAHRLGKSRGYLTFIGALIDAPDWLMVLYRNGRCRGLAELYELRRLHEIDPQAVAGWLATAPKLTRAEVQRFKDGLQTPVIGPSMLRPGAESSAPASAQRVSTASPASASKPASKAAPAEIVNCTNRRDPGEAANPGGPPLDALGFATLWARYDGVEVIVDLTAVPNAEGLVYVTLAGASERRAVEADRLTLLKVTRAVV